MSVKKSKATKIKKQKIALVTGSSGLVGSEVVRLLCDRGWRVYGIDNNTRAYLFGKEASTEPTREELEKKYPNFSTFKTDIRDEKAVNKIFKKYGPFDFIVHSASQPAHEWSTNHALEDFSLNATASMVMLEAYRQLSPTAVYIHVSSSKVYGDSVNELPLKEYKTRYDLPKNHPFYEGVDESMRLEGNLHSLFGASKACGDIMAHEYGTYFQLPINIFRPVCITGSAHKGTQLHGYLAYLVKCVGTGTKYIINGYKGKQVRDNIHGQDLARAFLTVYDHKERIKPGEAYNIGGGIESNNSILEAIKQAEDILGIKAITEYSDTNRRGDHIWCIYSSKKFRTDFPEWKLEFDNDRIMKDLCALYKNRVNNTE